MRLSAAAESGVIRVKWWRTEMSSIEDTIHLTSEAVTSGPSQGHPGTHSTQIHRICTWAGQRMHLARPSDTSCRGLNSRDFGREHPRLTCLRRGGACSDTGCRPHGTTGGSSGTATSSGSTSREDSTCGPQTAPSPCLLPFVLGSATTAPIPQLATPCTYSPGPPQ